MEPVFIKKLQVKKLFGQYSYSVEFTNTDLAFFYGPNGIGKTTLFLLLASEMNNVSSFNYAKPASIMFESFTVEFEGGASFKIIGPRDYGFDYPVASREDLERIGYNEEQLNTPKTQIHHPTIDRAIFIQTQVNEEIFKFVEEKISMRSSGGIGDIEELTRGIYSGIKNRLSSSIENPLHEQFQKLNNTLSIDAPVYINNFYPVLNCWKNKGAVDKKLYDILSKNPDCVSFLSKIDLLIEVFNSFYSDKDICKKVLFVDDSSGNIKIRNQNNDVIELSLLSSGELNLLRVLFKIIFESKDGSIFLLDEPEISLHFEWQQIYGDRLKKVINGLKELNIRIQIIAATHSIFVPSGDESLFACANFE